VVPFVLASSALLFPEVLPEADLDPELRVAGLMDRPAYFAVKPASQGADI